METTLKKKPPKHFTETGGLTSSVLFRKTGHMRTQRVSTTLRANVISLGDRWLVSRRSTDTADCLLTQRSDSRSALPTGSHNSQPPPHICGGNKTLEHIETYLLPQFSIQYKVIGWQNTYKGQINLKKNYCASKIVHYNNCTLQELLGLPNT